MNVAYLFADFVQVVTFDLQLTARNVRGCINDGIVYCSGLSPEQAIELSCAAYSWLRLNSAF